MILLASASPRRKELLTRYKIDFNLVENFYDEVLNQKLSPKKQALVLARGKVKDVLGRLGPQAFPVLGADTLLEFKGKSLGKAENYDQAWSTLKALRGRSHFVHTALCLHDPKTGIFHQSITSTRVKFRRFSDSDLKFYLETGEWKDAAGSYKIQETGEYLIEWIKGSYSNVVGLPISALYAILTEINPS